MLVFKTISPPHASIVVNDTNIPPPHLKSRNFDIFLLTDIQPVLRLVNPAGFIYTLSLSLSVQIFTQTSTKHSERHQSDRRVDTHSSDHHDI